MASHSGWNAFAKGLGDAIADIREKAYEEAWFGRTVTERGDGPDRTEATHHTIDNDAPQWPKAQLNQSQEPEQSKDIDNDIDR